MTRRSLYFQPEARPPRKLFSKRREPSNWAAELTLDSTDQTSSCDCRLNTHCIGREMTGDVLSW